MKRWHWISLAVLMAGSSVVERILAPDPHHSSHWWSHLPGFYGLFGFVGCIGIIVVSKLLGKKWLQKDEHYYDGE